ncbi:MAG TPA: hypothetical protein VH458_24975 [Vicinamibacterales bacterium]|jgi:hypothetical protein
MPPRHAYWTIIYASQPTAFRSATRDELLPTLRQLQSKHPDAVMMWFARGRLWRSPEEARDALERQRARPKVQWTGPRGSDESRFKERRPASESGTSSERRGRDWRPGGAHSDPRLRFKVPRDVKRRRFAARVRRDAVSPKPGGRPRRRPFKKKDDEE